MIRKITAAAAACALSSAAWGLDGIALEYGRGDDRTNLLRVAVAGQWRVASYWEVSAALWDNRDETTADVGLTPVFRLERRSVYLEGAIGVHLVTTHISAARVFSTAFQFAEHVGAGVRSGRYQVGLHAQHLSNGGVAKPNPGINFLLVRVQYALE